MSSVVMFVTFTLAPGASVDGFLLAAEKLHREVLSKQKGYVSWKQLVDGETWADMIVWETAEDAMNANEASCSNPVAAEYYAFLNMESCKANVFSVEKIYEVGRCS